MASSYLERHSTGRHRTPGDVSRPAWEGQHGKHRTSERSVPAGQRETQSTDDTFILGEDHLSSPPDVPEEVYVEKMANILSGPSYMGVPPEPSAITGNVYLGTSAQAENLDLLKRMRITHVLNVNGFPLGLKKLRQERYKNTPITYMELPIDDGDRAEIWPYFQAAHSFIHHGRQGGRVLICDSGVSRGGAIAIYFLVREGQRLLEATRTVKALRRVALTNRGFMEQLVNFARTYGLLDADVNEVRVPQFGRKIDRYRLNNSHLPMIL